jgi:DNA-binding MarR family transcriptional regulator
VGGESTRAPHIIKALEYPPGTAYPCAMASDAHPEAPQDLVRELLGVALAVRKRVRHALIERGHDLHPSHTAVIPNLPPGGMRLTELAERLRVSVQRAGQLVQELERAGYIEREGDADDRRAKRVRYSARGRRLMQDVADVDEELWRDLRARFGAAAVERLAETIGAIHREWVGPDAALLLEPRTAPRSRGKQLRPRSR